MAKYFNRHFLKTLALSTGVGAVSGYAVYSYLGSNDTEVQVQNGIEQRYYKIFENKETKWDSNWDKRQSKSLVKPVDSNKSDLQDKYDKKIESQKSRATRHIFLIRHGQYNLSGETDGDRKLTELGRKQALFTGERLSILDFPWTTITQSTLTRAMETCSIIQTQLPANIPLTSSDLLTEGAPIQPDPPSKHWKPELYFFRDGARIEAAFRKFIHRAPPDQKDDSYELIVCHANVIRYFVMRALQLNPEAWLRLSLDHASITWLSIYPNGRVSLRCYSNSGYMPPEAISR
ncbi:phosphoglycerate mutase family member 5 [Acyrthosiphon pisum]|uniref:Serine/threonine-protein phosphatase PGAM5, mitochondrial n=2 Tax=Acyrthosiphon pisum TaxID=7029 RepID=A0A8R1XII2_ACYPI|nr:phosphoglycerate mutase family member 5 [Acyrthosiphon pisum]|eukprot:NP_001161683.1 phosphoglycerate mutase family member 5 [Acyrthosiphon pisum]